MLYVLIGYLAVAFGALAGLNRLGICSDGGDMLLPATPEEKARARRGNAALAVALVVLAVVVGCAAVCVAFAGTLLGIAALVMLAGIALVWLWMGLRRVFASACAGTMPPALLLNT